MLITAIILLLAILLDAWLGEPKKYHPLVGFGNLALWLERKLNKPADPASVRLKGIVAFCLAIIPFVLLTNWLVEIPLLNELLSLYLLYMCIGANSLGLHARQIQAALACHDIKKARHNMSLIVSRDTQQLDQKQIAKATIESTLENGNDAIFAAIFWFIVAGAPGVLALRLSNTLDAMWGYRTPRYYYFGWCAARCDDVLNWVPARLTAFSYALLGETSQALYCWRKQARLHDSSNAGSVMAAGAGALELILGGGAMYHGKWKERPLFGTGKEAEVEDIGRALSLIKKTIYLWLFVVGILAFIETYAFA